MNQTHKSMAFCSAMTSASVSAPAMTMTVTENGAISNIDTGSSCLDYFSKAMSRDKEHCTPDETIVSMLNSAWKESPRDVLRLIAHKRDCRGGAGERHVACVSWKWLATNHPRIADANLENVPFYGRWQDLLDYFIDTPLEEQALDLMVSQLLNDYKTMRSAHRMIESLTDESDNSIREEAAKKLGTLTLCAKWAPSEGCKYDKIKRAGAGRYPVSHIVARKLYNKFNPSEAVHNHRMKWYRGVLSELRDSTNVVERLLCMKKWDDVEFSKIPSKAISLYSQKCFPKHMPERFRHWQIDVLAGKAKMNTSQVDPYEVVNRFIYKNPSPAEIPTLEAFYKLQVEELLKKGNLSNSLVIADVSGSMSGTPMAVSVSMAIWMSAITSPAFRDKFITFCSDPEFIDLCTCSTLQDKITKTMTAPWGMSTDLQKVFDLILSRAKTFNLKQEDMPTRLFIISDMQFNVACEPNLFTNFEVIKAKYRDSGYEVPEIVFWNVAGHTTNSPVSKDDKGVALVSGFSKDLINLFMLNEKLKSPYEVMRLAIDNSRYDRMILDHLPLVVELDGAGGRL